MMPPVMIGLALCATLAAARSAAAQGTPLPARPAHPPMDGAALYRHACASCHGGDGRGTDRALVMFEEPLPDFTDCGFSSREPSADWEGVAHEGGGLRGFSQMMPAFGDALSRDELARIVAHLKTLCSDRSWPRGELNLPRALFTEKAYPEDEWVFESGVGTGTATSISHRLVYERRFGARNQIELILPYGFQRVARVNGGSRWTNGVGDVAIGVKRVLTHGIESGHILSAAAELKLPTGNTAEGFGAGAKTAEAFLSFGKLLPSDAFAQLQAGAERVLAKGTSTELFWRGAVGRTWTTQGEWGRAWSPMLEVLGVKAASEEALWDVAPQLHVTLSTRQHVMLTLGPRFPLNKPDRPKSFVLSFIWDWADGGLREGW